MSYPEEREWKDIYKSQWKPGSNREKYVRELIENEFPDLEYTPGYGTEKDERIPYDPKHKRGAPDQYWSYKGKLLFQVEVTGTDKVVEDYVWIRPDKLEHALTDRTKGITTWVYAVYPNADYILATELVEKYKDDLRDHRPHGRIETFIQVPCDETRTRAHLFNWIREQQKVIVIRDKKLLESLPNVQEIIKEYNGSIMVLIDAEINDDIYKATEITLKLKLRDSGPRLRKLEYLDWIGDFTISYSKPSGASAK